MTYVLDWTRGKVRGIPGQAGWEVTNDLGYVVRVTGGYLVSRSLELVPCDPLPPAVSLPGPLSQLLGPQPAFAGHTTIADPSATRNAVVESLLQPQRKQPATLYPGAQAYCRAHYLIARADTEAAGLPAEVDMVDQTLRVEGSFLRPGGATFEPFAVTTAVANGKLIELTSPGDVGNRERLRLNTEMESAVVIVRRHLDTIFDHVDFLTMNDKHIARAMLQNLIDGVEVEVRVDGHAGK